MSSSRQTKALPAIATVVSQAVAVMLATVVYPRTRVIFGMQVRALTLRGMRIS